MQEKVKIGPIFLIMPISDDWNYFWVIYVGDRIF